jgi:DNA-binding CsgD family transcriptional regulator
MEPHARERILARYRAHAERFDILAGRAASSRLSENRFFGVQASRDFSEPLAGQLTAREHEVLHAAADGLTDEEIGARLFIHAFTVKSHLKHIYAKLGARNRAHAVALGYRRELLTPDSAERDVSVAARQF